LFEVVVVVTGNKKQMILAFELRHGGLSCGQSMGGLWDVERRMEDAELRRRRVLTLPQYVVVVK